MFELKGRLKELKDTRQVSEKFAVREFVLTDESNAEYPQHIQFQATQDRCPLLDSFKVGDEVKASFNVRGREWTNPQGEVKYFNSLDAWRIESISNDNPAPAPQPVNMNSNDGSDLPF